MKYSEIEKRQYDAQQMILNSDLSISQNKRKFAKKQYDTNFEEIVMCPFCLESNELGKYRFTHGFRICPYCMAKLKTTTLTEIKDIEKFVKFMFEYRFMGGWDKTYPDFETWNKKLYSLGLSHDFWLIYHRLKGDSKEDFIEE